MQCSSPVELQATGAHVSCGQCMSCRINKSRLWTARLIMESHYHPIESQYFVTLTYDEGNVPRGTDGLMTLAPRDAVLFRDRLRKANPGFRFFHVGEYGAKFARPHYHLILFGVPLFDRWKGVPVDPAVEVEKQWKHGSVDVRPVNRTRLSYIAQYTTKKMSGDRADSHYGSRHPEFAQMSRRPALGDEFIKDMGGVRQKGVRRFVELTGDVPQQFRYEGAVWPIGDRHVKMLRRLVGLPDKRCDVARADARVAAVDRVRQEVIITMEEILARRAKEKVRVKRQQIYSGRF